MNIPIGHDYTFNIRVLEDGSTLPRDISNILSASFTILNMDGTDVAGGGIVISSNGTSGDLAVDSTKSDTRTVTTVITTSAGIVQYTNVETTKEVSTGNIGSTETTVVEEDTPIATQTTTTTTLSVISRNASGTLVCKLSSLLTGLLTHTPGAAEDDFYSKAEYKGGMLLKFTDGPDVSVVIPKISAIQAG